MADGLPGYVGQSVPRREDKRLLLGQGRYVADIQLPGMAHVAFARADLPHGRIKSVDLARTRQAQGVIFAATGADEYPIARFYQFHRRRRDL